MSVTERERHRLLDARGECPDHPRAFVSGANAESERLRLARERARKPASERLPSHVKRSLHRLEESA